MRRSRRYELSPKARISILEKREAATRRRLEYDLAHVYDLLPARFTSADVRRQLVRLGKNSAGSFGVVSRLTRFGYARLEEQDTTGWRTRWFRKVTPGGRPWNGSSV